MEGFSTAIKKEMYLTTHKGGCMLKYISAILDKYIKKVQKPFGFWTKIKIGILFKTKYRQIQYQ